MTGGVANAERARPACPTQCPLPQARSPFVHHSTPNQHRGLPGSQAPSPGPFVTLILPLQPFCQFPAHITMSPPSQLGVNGTLFHEAAYQIHSLYPLIKKAIKFVCSNLCCTNSWWFFLSGSGGSLGAPWVELFTWGL